jgi:UDP-glucose 4-epimerase
MGSPRTKDRVLVTGGCGFVGFYVTNQLLARGYDVTAFDSAPRRDDISCDYIHGDICNKSAMETVMLRVNPKYVVHLAAVHYIPYCNSHPLETFATNVQGTATLLSVCGNVEKLFVASSAAVYTPSEQPHAEDSLAWPVDIYGFSKRVMEFLVQEWSKRTGKPAVIGRFFNMYGWGETTPHLIPVIVKQVLDGADCISLGNTRTRRDFTHVSDSAKATIDLIEMPTSGCVLVNLGSGKSYSAKNIIDMLSAIRGRVLETQPDSRKMRVSDRPLLVADTTLAELIGLGPHKTPMIDGLATLLETGIGPYLEEL